MGACWHAVSSTIKSGSGCPTLGLKIKHAVSLLVPLESRCNTSNLHTMREKEEKMEEMKERWKTERDRGYETEQM